MLECRFQSLLGLTAFSEARHQGFSLGTLVSSFLHWLMVSANEIELKLIWYELCETEYLSYVFLSRNAHVACNKHLCCMPFAHNCTLAIWAYILFKISLGPTLKMHWPFKKFTKNQLYSLFGPNQFNDTHKWTVNAATALLWHAIHLCFDNHMSWLVIFCWKGGELPKCLKFEEHVLEQKLVKHVLQHAFGHNLCSPKCLYKQHSLRKNAMQQYASTTQTEWSG